jgi:hypothetical protein
MKAILIVLLLNLAFTQVTILGPGDLVELMKQTQSNASYKIGNFGEIPYGKTIVYISNIGWKYPLHQI